MSRTNRPHWVLSPVARAGVRRDLRPVKTGRASPSAFPTVARVLLLSFATLVGVVALLGWRATEAGEVVVRTSNRAVDDWGKSVLTDVDRLLADLAQGGATKHGVALAKFSEGLGLEVGLVVRRDTAGRTVSRAQLRNGIGETVALEIEEGGALLSWVAMTPNLFVPSGVFRLAIDRSSTRPEVLSIHLGIQRVVEDPQGALRSEDVLAEALGVPSLGADGQPGPALTEWIRVVKAGLKHLPIVGNQGIDGRYRIDLEGAVFQYRPPGGKGGKTSGELRLEPAVAMDLERRELFSHELLRISRALRSGAAGESPSIFLDPFGGGPVPKGRASDLLRRVASNSWVDIPDAARDFGRMAQRLLANRSLTLWMERQDDVLVVALVAADEGPRVVLMELLTGNEEVEVLAPEDVLAPK